MARIHAGLCGGMVLESVRRWQEHEARPTLSAADLRDVFAAQLRSFHIPWAPWRYLSLQQTNAHAARTRTTAAARRTLLKALRARQPIPLALVSALGRSPLLVTEHHIVLAYAAAHHDSGETVVHVYDPNYRDRDDVTLTFSDAGVRHSQGRRVHAVFSLPRPRSTSR